MSLPQFIDEPILVQVHLLPDGAAQLIAFVWRERTYILTDWGRQWDDLNDGVQRRCCLARAANGETFELWFAGATGRWVLHRAWLSTKHDV